MAKATVASIKPAREANRRQSSDGERLAPWNGDISTVFVVREEISRSDCYDAATLKMEEAEELLRGTYLFLQDDETRADPVTTAVLALLQQARAAYRSSFLRAQ